MFAGNHTQASDPGMWDESIMGMVRSVARPTTRPHPSPIH